GWTARPLYTRNQSFEWRACLMEFQPRIKVDAKRTPENNWETSERCPPLWEDLRTPLNAAKPPARTLMIETAAPTDFAFLPKPSKALAMMRKSWQICSRCSSASVISNCFRSSIWFIECLRDIFDPFEAGPEWCRRKG